MMLRPTLFRRVLFFLSADIIISFFTLFLAYELRFNFAIPDGFGANLLLVYLTLLPLKLAALGYFRLYQVAWRFFGLSEAKRLVIAHLLAYGAFALIYTLAEELYNPFPRSVLLIDFFLSASIIGALRISKRLYLENSFEKSVQKALIIGVRDDLSQIIKSALSGEIAYYPAAIVERDDALVGTYIANLKVHDMQQLEAIVAKEGITSALIAKKLPPAQLNALFERLKNAGIKDIKLIRIFDEHKRSLENLSIEDLLARKPKDLDKHAIAGFVKGQKVMITGAGGSIGSEIVRQCMEFGAQELLLVDNSEFALYSICEEVGEKRIPYIPKLVSITKKEELAACFEEFAPDILIHAAAYKHVPLCEKNIKSAIENNIIGSRNVIDLAIANSVKKVVIISTDKAIRPTNIMGATKRVVELYAQNVQSQGSEIVAVRFGNVLGSSGSVVPKFKKLLEEGKPLQVTHPDVTRYFMTIPEACQLVLQAGAIASGKEVFILDMGEPVRIVDLAKKMLRLYGRSEENIEYCGLRPGEKLYEELLIDESERKTMYESIHVARPIDYDITKLSAQIGALKDAQDPAAALKAIVPEFQHNKG